MAGLGDLLQRVARSLEEANAQQPADDLRARLGYGTGDDEDEAASDSDWDRRPEPELEPDAHETERRPASTRESGLATRPGAAPGSRPDAPRAPGSVWKPEPPPAPAPATPRVHAPYRMPTPDRAPGSRPSPPAAPHHPRASPASLLLSDLVRARLHTPDTLREAFVVKELLDRPLGLRHRK